ncbi:MAG: GYD domain-containing protein [bacterium]|nr:GYD domain-containing protein [bacterium]
MPLYALFSKLTDEGWKTVRNNPDRIQAVNKELEGMGGKVISQYAALGPYDFITIVEAADNLTAGNLSVQLGARGTVQIQTIPLIAVQDFVKKIKATA